jgi:hypothetical protein
MAEALFVCGFQKTRPEATMDLDGRTKDRARTRIPIVFFGFLGFYVD